MNELRRPRVTIRTRLTLTYAGLVTVCGAILIAIVYVFMRFVPTYAFVGASDLHGLTRPPVTMPPDGTHETVVPGSAAETISINSAEDVVNTLLLFAIIALVILAAISSGIGWVVAGRVLAPLQAINRAASVAATGALDHRVGHAGPRDEIRDLSDTFDSMLDSLESSFNSHRRFAANASHELRTPLTTTQTMIQVTLADPDADTATLRALATRIGMVNRGNIDTVEALLDLATIGSRTLRLEPVDLKNVVNDAVAALRGEADDAGIAVVWNVATEADGLSVKGDQTLMLRAVTNVIHNAIRHNTRGGTVDIDLTSNADSTTVRVINSGAFVPQEIVSSLREPFVRGAGRTGTRGHGLGLAITETIVEAHGGKLKLEANEEGGLTVEIELSAHANTK